MFSYTPPRLLAILTFIILTILYVGFSWIELHLGTQQEPQVLPILARIQVARQNIYLEVPQTLEQRLKGLMYRTVVPRNRGILFEFEPSQIVTLSMQNIFVPLDMIFLKDGQIELIRVAVPPCIAEICSAYSSNIPVDQAIQLREQRTLELGLKVGDRLPVQFLDPDTKIFR